MDSFRLPRTARVSDVRAKADPSLPSEVEEVFLYDGRSWRETAGQNIASSLPAREVLRQEAIHELFMTEASHLSLLHILTVLFYQRLWREQLLSQEELALIFPDLRELLKIHSSLSGKMRDLLERGPLIGEIGDLLLSQFGVPASEEFRQAILNSSLQQARALELLTAKQQRDARFRRVIQEIESSPECHHRRLTDFLGCELQRLASYPLLLSKIIQHTNESTYEHQCLCLARDEVKGILEGVQEELQQAEQHRQLQAYQQRLDARALRKSTHPLAREFQKLDLTEHKIILEGPLQLRVSDKKTVGLHILLLGHLIVFLKPKGQRMQLKCFKRKAGGSPLSPVVPLETTLVRPAATDPTSFFLVYLSEEEPEIYELVASSPSKRISKMVANCCPGRQPA